MRTNSRISFSVIVWIILSVVIYSCKVQEPTIGIPNQKDRDPDTINIYVEEGGKKVTKSVNRSKVDNLDKVKLEEVNKYLSSIDPSYPDTNDFIFINYYPGKDKCNSTGLMTSNEFGKRELFFDSEIPKRENVTNSRVYKNDIGLERYNKESTWHKDINQIIERTFFEYHYLRVSLPMLKLCHFA